MSHVRFLACQLLLKCCIQPCKNLTCVKLNKYLQTTSGRFQVLKIKEWRYSRIFGGNSHLIRLVKRGIKWDFYLIFVCWLLTVEFTCCVSFCSMAWHLLRQSSNCSPSCPEPFPSSATTPPSISPSCQTETDRERNSRKTRKSENSSKVCLAGRHHWPARPETGGQVRLLLGNLFVISRS